MVLDIILLVIGLTGLIIASIIDIRSREVPDLLNYGLIIVGSAIHILNAIISSNFSALLSTFLGFLALFVIANLMYYSKQWGGGDAKLLMATSIMFAQYPSVLLNFFSPSLQPFPFQMTLFINLLIVGSIYGLLYTIAIAYRNRKNFSGEFKAMITDKRLRFTKWFSGILSIVLLALIFILDKALISPITVAMLVFVVGFPYLIVFVKAVEKGSMYKLLDVSRLTEGDWVAKDVVISGRKIYSNKSPGITKQQIQKLREYHIKKVLVKEGIPFVPSFLISIILTLIFGNLIRI